MADTLRALVLLSELLAFGLLTHGVVTKRIPWRYAFGFYIVFISAIAFTFVTMIRPPGINIQLLNFWSQIVRLQFITLSSAGIYAMFRRGRINGP